MDNLYIYKQANKHTKIFSLCIDSSVFFFCYYLLIWCFWNPKYFYENKSIISKFNMKMPNLTNFKDKLHFRTITIILTTTKKTPQKQKSIHAASILPCSHLPVKIHLSFSINKHRDASLVYKNIIRLMNKINHK
jgi:hypothetical protein